MPFIALHSRALDDAVFQIAKQTGCALGFDPVMLELDR